MTEKLSGARSDDCSSLRETILSYVAIDYESKSLNPVIAPKSAKSGNRGFFHPVLGRLLCPAKYSNEFDLDPKG
jgi:hypothetical protein